MKTFNSFQWLRLQRFETECTENAYLCQIYNTLVSAIPFIITVIGFLLMSVYLFSKVPYALITEPPEEFLV